MKIVARWILVRCFQTRCFASGYSCDDRSTGALLFFRPMAGNSSHPLWVWSLTLITTLLLGGCATLQTDAPPTQSSNNTAVIALLNKAQYQSTAGRLDEARANLERALRIEPRNAVLWQELARVRLEQGQYRQAENLAAKSNVLAGTNRYLQAKNWRIIGEARSRRGDLQGARQAFEKAEQSP
jgi:tetratricopeptide (TPR) repeat protein